MLITSVIATSDNAFAQRKGHSKSYFNGIGSYDDNGNGASQSIFQSNRQSARSTLVTDGAYSDVDRTDNIFQFATNDYRDGSDNVDE